MSDQRHATGTASASKQNRACSEKMIIDQRRGMALKSLLRPVKWVLSILVATTILFGHHPMATHLRPGLVLFGIAVLWDEITHWPPVVAILNCVLSILRLAYYASFTASLLGICHRLATDPLLLQRLWSVGSALESQAFDRLLVLCQTPDITSSQLRPFHGLASKLPELNEALDSWYDEIDRSCGHADSYLKFLDLRPPTARLAALRKPANVMLETMQCFDQRLITVVTGLGKSRVLLDSANHASMVFAGSTLLNVTRTIEDGMTFFRLVLRHAEIEIQASSAGVWSWSEGSGKLVDRRDTNVGNDMVDIEEEEDRAEGPLHV